jgi:glycosyltransferase involved in cell wall biosynthesis
MFNIPDDCVIFIYQGVVNKGRGIELLIDTFGKLPSDKHLVIMGYGPFVSQVKTAEKNHFNIHFLPAVPPDEILNYTSGADVGISMIENISLSYYFCLPNKLFEYLHCGMPVIVSDFPDMGNLIRSFDCGWVSEVNLDEFKQVVSIISSESINKKRIGVSNARKVLNWENESRQLSKSFPLINNN